MHEKRLCGTYSQNEGSPSGRRNLMGLLMAIFIFLPSVLLTSQIPMLKTGKTTHQNCCTACCCSVTKSCPTPCEPTDYSPPGSSVHRISQAVILKWVAISFSRESSPPRNRTHVSCTGQVDSLPQSRCGSPTAQLPCSLTRLPPDI